MIDRAELAAFLRTRRHRLHPDDVGLPGNGPRRTPGLRRQEVAELAGISVDYYIRLEQGRGPHPSKQVLSALARGLLLSIDEREYLFRLVGQEPPRRHGPSREVPDAVRLLLDTLTETPAYVLDAKYDVLAWNRLATFFTGDLSAVDPEQRNIVRWMFSPGQDDHPRWQDPDTVSFARASVADLRAAYGRYRGDTGIERLVAELLAASPRFAEIWAAQEVEVRRRTVKRVDHPDHGPLEFQCQVLHIPDSDQRLIIYCAEPGSPTAEAFSNLARMDDGHAPEPRTARWSCAESASAPEAGDRATTGRLGSQPS
jgi:transcriptional regulator with XRE-family HTH domain